MDTSTSNRDREAAAILAKGKQLVDGLENDWPASQQTIIYDQVSYTPAAFKAKVEAAIAPLEAVVDARGVYRTALTNRHTAMPDTTALIKGFLTVLPHYLPPGADVTKFGATPPKPRTPQTVEQKAVSNQKREATRKARHIMGKKQRQAIKAPAPEAPPTPEPTPIVPPAPILPKTGG